jgi:4-diphosphocytidyl-2-C-methyl-D-erythritol kinase
MRNSLRAAAHAKLNLTLAVTGRRADGYHLLDSVMQSVELSNRLTAERREADLVFACDDPLLPTDERNTAVRAAKVFFARTGIDGGASLTLEKRIPYEAGLGSASADAAAVLAVLNELYDRPLPPAALLDAALAVGADVPFCLTGGTKRATGIGEVLSDAPALTAGAFLILKPAVGISTPAAYRAIDEAAAPPVHDLAAMETALADGDLAAVGAALQNDFLVCCAEEEPRRLVQKLCSVGALGASMSGSGSAVFGFFSDETAARQAQERLRGEAPFSAVTRPVREGISFLF